MNGADDLETDSRKQSNEKDSFSTSARPGSAEAVLSSEPDASPTSSSKDGDIHDLAASIAKETGDPASEPSGVCIHRSLQIKGADRLTDES